MSTAARRRGFGQRAGFALALCVPASAGAALVLHAVRAAEVPSHADWVAAAGRVRSAWQPGDLVTFLPGWAQEGRGEFAGLSALPDENWNEDTIAAAKRLHVVVSFGAALPRWLPASAKVESREKVGKLEVVRLTRAASAPLYDFTSAAGEASVSLEWRGLPAEECTKAGARHDCSQQGKFPWRYVAEQRLPVGGRARRCLWAHPTQSASLRIRYPAAPLGQSLRVDHGFADGVANSGAPVQLEVYVGDERVGSVTRAPKSGWSREVVSTAAHAGKTAPVSFVISTSNDGSRHFCFAAEALP